MFNSFLVGHVTSDTQKTERPRPNERRLALRFGPSVCDQRKMPQSHRREVIQRLYGRHVRSAEWLSHEPMNNSEWFLVHRTHVAVTEREMKTRSSTLLARRGNTSAHLTAIVVGIKSNAP